MDLFYFCSTGNPVYKVFQPAPGEAVMGSPAAYKEGRIIICPHFKIILQMNMGLCVKISDTLFIAFAEYDNVITGKRDIGPVKAEQLRGPYRRTVQALNNGQVALRLAGGAEFLHLFGR